MPSTVTSKGQVTISKPVPDYLGIVPGSEVKFELHESGNVIVPHLDGNRRPRETLEDIGHISTI